MHDRRAEVACDDQLDGARRGSRAEAAAGQEDHETERGEQGAGAQHVCARRLMGQAGVSGHRPPRRWERRYRTWNTILDEPRASDVRLPTASVASMSSTYRPGASADGSR